MYNVNYLSSYEELQGFIESANIQKHEIVGFVREAVGYTVIYKTHKPAEFI
jgi:hypothetical protein